MNDLEHDLRELFERRATDVDVPGLAPKPVLQRGRRRQVGTIVTGVLACLVAAGVAAAAIGQARHPNVIPGEGNGLPARTTSIGGVPVTAPAGWTLVDDWPLVAVLGTSRQTCSFTATGAAVAANGSPVEGSPSPVEGSATGNSGSTSGQSCTQESTSLDTSLPFFQLANFSVPLTQTLCKSDLDGAVNVPDDGVAVYVGLFPAGTSRGTLGSSCASADVFQYGQMPGTSGAVLAAVAIEGRSASESDRTVAEDYVHGFEPGSVTLPRPTEGTGPGYVLASGSGAGTAWRLEAGITSLGASNDSAHVGAIMVATDSTGTAARTVDLPTQQHIADDYVDLGGGSGVQFGTATADVIGINVDLPSNGTVAATVFPLPHIVIPDLPSSDGSIWFAETPKRGEVHAAYPSVPPASPTPDQQSPAPPGPLQTRTDANGNYVIYGNDFGHDWSFTQERSDGTLMFSLDGAEPSTGYTYASGSSTQIDIGGGTLMLAFEPPTVDKIWVTSNVEGSNVVATGRMAPAADYAASRANIWVVAMPGAGSGFAWSTDRVLPLAVTWPTQPTTTPGYVFGAGITDGVSWTQTWSENGCPTLQVVASTSTGDTGSVGCPVAWNDRAYPHSVSYVGGVYGQHHAVVLITGPENMCADVHADGDPQAGAFCSSSVAGVAPWSSTGACIVVIPVGETWRIQPTLKDGSAFGRTITITAKPGSIVQG